MGFTAQVGDERLKNNLLAVKKTVLAGCLVCFDEGYSYVFNKRTKTYTKIDDTEAGYTLTLWVPRVGAAQPFTRQTQR